MNFVTPEINWVALLPILIVLGTAAISVLIEAFMRTHERRRMVQITVSLVALVTAFGFAAVQWATLEGAGVEVMAKMITVDRQSLTWQTIILVFGVLAIFLFSARTREGEDAFTGLGAATPGSIEERVARRKGMVLTEVYPFAMFSLGGMMLFTTVTDFLFLFVALEVLSLPLYILVGLSRRRRLISQEASLKYFLLGAFSGGIVLFGAALIYGATATTSFADVAYMIGQVSDRDAMMLAGAVLVLVGLLFKLGAAPFHTWVPDVYQGAPTPVVAFMAAATKAAAAAALLRILFVPFNPLEWELSWLIWAVAITSMVLGTVVALVQADLKRMFAYSWIVHAGFIMVAFAGHERQALSALPFYVFTYGLASIGGFAVMTQVRERTEAGSMGAEATRLGQWAGLVKRSPFLAISMGIFLLSLAGIPLTAGFIGKFQAFAAGFAGGAWGLVLAAVLASCVAAFFYIRPVVLMFFTDVPDGTEDDIAVDDGRTTRIVIGFTAVATVVLGIVPAVVLNLFQDSATLLVTLGG